MFFKTKDLLADKLTLFDADEFFRICNQRFILKWMDDWEMNLEQVKNLLTYFITGYDIKNPEKAPFIMAIRTKDGSLIGICRFGAKDELGGDAEIAYFIDEGYAEKGFMSQIVQQAIVYYFTMAKKPYLCALVDENNMPSRKS